MRPVAAANLELPDIAADGASTGRRLRHVFLLSGAPRPGGFLANLGCNVLDLPVDGEADLLDLWCERLTQAMGEDRLSAASVQVLCDPRIPLPRESGPRGPGVRVALRRDSRAHRGTGGALRDAIDRFDADDEELALVLPAAQFPSAALPPLIARALEVNADAVVICAGHDAPPVGFIVRCGLLRAIRNAGYIDLKEQALAQFARTHDVCVIRAADVVAQHIATLEDYLQSLSLAALDADETFESPIDRASLGEVSIDCSSRAGDGVADVLMAPAISPSRSPVMRDAFACLEGRSRFAIVQNGAVAEDGAVLHDAVALAGSVVHRGAIVARSVLTAGAIVGPNEVIVDRIVTARFQHSLTIDG